MRLVVQRVSGAAVRVDGALVAEIGAGLAVLVGVRISDTKVEAEWLAEKVGNLRIFSDEGGKMNRSLLEVGGAVLSVSQFTLYADTGRGRRPSFIDAATGAEAEGLYEAFNAALRGQGIPVATGRFGAVMEVEIRNDGPVTFTLERERGSDAG